MRGLAASNAPSWSLPSRYFAGGMIFWLMAMSLLLADPGMLTGRLLLAPRVLAVVHLTTLGWLTMVMQGALYQLLPVVLQTRMHSEFRGKVTFYAYTAGVATMALGFWYQQTAALVLGGILVAVVLIGFVDNAFRTLWRARPWDIHGKYLAAAMICLGLVSLLGVSLLLAKAGIGFTRTRSLSHLGMHVYLGAGGWFSFLLVGVSYKLVPMFTLVHDAPGKNAERVLVLMIAGMCGALLAIGFHWDSLLLAAPFGLYLSGLLLYVWDMSGIYRRRFRRTPDLSLEATLFGLLLLAILVVATGALAAAELFWRRDGIWISSPQTGALGALLLWGVFSGVLWSQLYKIVPFLVWLHRYSKRVGQQKVPAMQDLVLPKVDRWYLAAHYTGALITALGMLSMQTFLAWIGVLVMALGGLGLAGRLFGLMVAGGGEERDRQTRQGEHLQSFVERDRPGTQL